MKKFITTIRNIFSIEELRTRILTTVYLLLIFRLGSFIVLPGIDPVVLQKADIAQQGIFGLLDTFLGGAFSKASIFALGIMPYISASIVVQLLTVAMPYFQKMQKEGESGRNKINQITRLLTIVITFAQALGYLTTTIPTEAILVDLWFFRVSSVIIITAGTIFTMWIGERITDKGIGNGISMLIMIGIISRLPAALVQEVSSRFAASQALLLILELIALFFVVMAVVLFTQATRKVPVQYAKQVVGNKVYGGQRQYIPLKVNAAGVMPIIFAQSMMFLPGMTAGYFAASSDFAASIATTFQDYTSWQYNLLFVLLIIVFTYFYTAISINPNQIADDMKRSGGFIPGVKPGAPTSEHIDSILSKITLPGSIFLAIVAILPALAVLFNVKIEFSQFYGGTSLLIMVGVVLDTLQQINSYLLMKRYEGMMKSGKVKGRSQDIAVA
ncbi:preprotein translocase subunit SecY [Eisenibacter elegans]|jgi:preprotein translocase subunit SecY|uniref:preprotein translocase subunit SecY n=1 Tax=Eisenibacter elegans TaxID=997 RepID=UPI0004124220|nr:preprotein translocase subunit SecY [Eisenibacter elegans]